MTVKISFFVTEHQSSVTRLMSLISFMEPWLVQNTSLKLCPQIFYWIQVWRVAWPVIPDCKKLCSDEAILSLCHVGWSSILHQNHKILSLENGCNPCSDSLISENLCSVLFSINFVVFGNDKQLMFAIARDVTDDHDLGTEPRSSGWGN